MEKNIGRNEKVELPNNRFVTHLYAICKVFNDLGKSNLL